MTTSKLVSGEMVTVRDWSWFTELQSGEMVETSHYIDDELRQYRVIATGLSVPLQKSEWDNTQRYGDTILWDAKAGRVCFTDSQFLKQLPYVPKYRPWRPEEALGMKVRKKAEAPYRGGGIIVWANEIHANVAGHYVGYKTLFDEYEQLDRSPCGVLEDA